MDAMVETFRWRCVYPYNRVIPDIQRADQLSVYRAFFDDFEKSVSDGTSNECFAAKFNSVVEKYKFVRYLK